MKSFIGFLFICWSTQAFGQGSWVFFNDKGPQAETQLLHPETYLSQRALERRAKNRLPVDVTDVPVYAPYVRQLEATGAPVAVTSRWLNAAFVDGPVPKAVERLPCVARIWTPPPSGMHSLVTEGTAVDFGEAREQLELHNLQLLHDAGFRGNGILMALFDSGYLDMPNNPGLAGIFAAKRLVANWDFYTNDTLTYDHHWHGSDVLSLISGYIPGTYVGAAPEVSLALARTEVTAFERNLEEANWLAAAEWADSLGVDIINSSLGYSEFDAGETSYSYAEMDGQTAVVTQAATFARQKGILVVTSAGNEGATPWFRITAPCDADSILCVGAINVADTVAPFSSRGPAADDRLKPDLVAVGQDAVYINSWGNVRAGNGTSYASPIIAGMAAVLMQAHPSATVQEIRTALLRSCNRYNKPDSAFGHGYPQMRIADSLLTDLTTTRPAGASLQLQLHIGPNPAVQGRFSLWVEAPATPMSRFSCEVRNATGQLILRRSDLPAGVKLPFSLNVPAGVYVVRVIAGEHVLTQRIVVP